MDTILDYLNPRQDEFLTDLAELVNIDAPSRDKAAVDAVVERVRRRLERAGFTVRTLPLVDYGDCLEATMTGSGSLKLMLLGHSDSVYPRGTVAERPLTIQDGRILGPGANDMKAGLLAGIYAVEALRASGWDDFAEITFFCNSEEEIGSPVSAALYADAARRSDVALVLEAAREDGSIVSARKGGGHFTVTVTGRSAHAGVEPHKGASAILELAHHVQAIHDLNGLAPGTTATVGLIRGGSVANAVPDRAVADVDVRVARPEDMARFEEALRQALAWPHVSGTTTEVTGSFGAYPMRRTPAIERMADLAREVAATLGIRLLDVTTGGVSDANKVAALGTPVLDGLGPVGGLDHSPGEYVEQDSIAPRTALLAGLIQALAVHREELVTLKEEDEPQRRRGRRE